jgi:hypothetical protein
MVKYVEMGVSWCIWKILEVILENTWLKNWWSQTAGDAMCLMKLPQWHHFALTSFPAYISCLPQSVFVTWPTFCCSGEGTWDANVGRSNTRSPVGLAILQGIHLTPGTSKKITRLA